jgi:hypothetical protein
MSKQEYLLVSLKEGASEPFDSVDDAIERIESFHGEGIVPDPNDFIIIEGSDLEILSLEMGIRVAHD